MASDKANILVVDDLPEKLLATELILEDLHQNVVTVTSGREALRRLLEMDFAVILLDVNMPGMDGFETAELIRQRRSSRETPIIFITAFSDDLHAAQGYSLGAVDYILSPVVPEVLRTKVGVFVELYRKTEQVKRQAEERVALAREQVARAAAEEARRRSQFLVEASTALADSLDFQATRRALLHVVVPSLADLAGVTISGDHGLPWQTELAWVCPPDTAIHGRMFDASEEPVDPLRSAVEHVLVSGRSEVVNDLAVAYPPGTTSTGLLRTAVVLPLRARGRTLAALMLARTDLGKPFTSFDISLAEDLVGRAAVALDNSRLFHEVQEADRNKNEFLAMLAHELRNPLAPICNAVYLLRSASAAMPSVGWAVDMIDRQTQQLVRLVDDLLDVSRITRGKIQLQFAVVNVAELLERAVETSRPIIDAKKHELTVDAPTALWARIDPARVAQILSNLLNNAAKYTEPGGRIWLTAERDGNDLLFRARDTGIGIAPEMLPKVFELFTQADRSLDRSQGGLGVGLTLVRRLVELHGGTAAVSSAGLNQGSEFLIRLPVIVEPPRAPANPVTNGPMKTEDIALRALVVDDNQDAASSLAYLLREEGHEVSTVFDGLAAVKEAQSFHPNIVLLDLGLPGKSGYEVARELRQSPGGDQMYLVALTGYGQDEDRRLSREAGFDQHLVKPISPEALASLFASQRTRMGAANGHMEHHQPAPQHR
jgi:signal transduction histidine kinase/DNA-binding response OmpR family regulator